MVRRSTMASGRRRRDTRGLCGAAGAMWLCGAAWTMLPVGRPTRALAAINNSDVPSVGEDISLLTLIAGTPICNTGFDESAGVLVYSLVVLYTFVGLAILCDEYFCESLEKICTALKLSEDVAGATFMAAGSSAPELVTACITIFIAPGQAGVGTIVGSAVFNLCVIVGLSCLCSHRPLALFWWPVTRDASVYLVSILAMLWAMTDGLVTAFEGFVMTCLYVIYLTIMIFNRRIVDRIQRGSVGRGKLRAANGKMGLQMVGLEDGKEGGTTRDTEAAAAEADAPVESESKEARDEAQDEAGAAPAGEEGKEAEDGGSDGILSRIGSVLSLPLAKLLAWTIPDCREEKWETWYIGTFTMSIFYIGLFSFIMVDFATRAACILRIPELLVGMIILAVGTSVPDALASIIVARQGQGNMAVSNAIGSNVFNILLGLGLPWWIKAAADGEPYAVPDFSAVGEPLIILLIYVVLFMVVVMAGGWQLSRRVGVSLLACQAAYTGWTMLRNFPVGAPVIAF